jgi:hypothetical protein
LLADLTAGLKLPHALLSTDEGNSRARSFYAALGWQEILGGVDLSSTRGTYVILARALQ